MARLTPHSLHASTAVAAACSSGRRRLKKLELRLLKYGSVRLPVFHVEASSSRKATTAESMVCSLTP